MNLNLIIDCNYVLSRLVFTLHKNNLLYGELHRALENSLSQYRTWYPFSTIYLVSDSKEKSWRKKFHDNYKSQRKKNGDIDWKFVYDTYSEFKNKVNGVTVLECPRVEGDDWISMIVEDTNKKGHSNFIVSNDHDIKQLLNMSLDPMWINIMSNEMYNKSHVFFPKNYKMFFHNLINNKKDDDIFNLSNDDDFISLYERLINKHSFSEVDPVESLMTKVVSGDRSDNIPSVHIIKSNNGKIRGIGTKGAKDIYDFYIKEFGEVRLDDPNLVENFADLICEKKKISKTNIGDISKRIYENFKMIDLKTDNIPPNLYTEMKEIYG